MKSKSKSRKPGDKCKIYPMELPDDYVWKILGWLTDDLGQFLTDSEKDRMKAIVRSRSIDDVLALSEEWGLQSMPTSDGGLAEKRARYQLAALLKKFRFATERESRVSAAVKKFLDGETYGDWYNREGYNQLSVASESWMVNVFTYARSFMQKLLGSEVPDLNVMTERSRHGPGATTDTQADHVSSYFKFWAWPYCCTARAYRYARLLISSDERWLGALEDDYRARNNIPKWAILDRRVFWQSVIHIVDGNRVAFVPKNARVERSIAIEPTLNVYLQLGVDGHIRRRLKRWGVDLDHQEKNQEMSRLGSQMHWIDPFVTIDLANASNSVFTKLVQLLCPPEWYDLFMDLRSPRGDLKGDIIDYQMISSMGNGYTFALESAIFTSIIYGVMKETNGKYSHSECAVYGDDLIVRRSISQRVIDALTKCGFQVNLEKSCFQDGIRESCGCDWFQGHLVRPVFFEDNPKDVTELFTDINRLKRILEVYWGIEESKTVSNMLKWVPIELVGIRGPYSDIEFDGYLHTKCPPIGSGRGHGVYQYQRIVHLPRKLKATSFFFRKLMHDLHPAQLSSQKWDKKLTGSGSRFGVYRRNANTLCNTYSNTSEWCPEYTEYRPTWSPRQVRTIIR